MSDKKKYEHNDPAPEGQVYVCGACGKQSPTRSGWNHDGQKVAKNMWDVSCMVNAVLCYADGPPWKAVTEN